jgi:long-chain acyl-CoA synthetase
MMVLEQPDLPDLVQRSLNGLEDRAAIQFHDRWHDWRWLRSLADQLDAAILASGVASDAPIGLVARNDPAFAAGLLALMAARRTIVMIYSLQSHEAIARDITALNLALVIADERDWTEQTIAAAQEARTGRISIDYGAETIVLKAAGETGSSHRVNHGEPGIEMLTSGTTGTPKRVVMPYSVLSKSIIEPNIVSNADSGGSATPTLVCYPFGNISGIRNYMPHVIAGTPVILVEKFTLEVWLEIVRTYRPSQTGIPPNAMRTLLDSKVPPEDLASLEFIGVGTTRVDMDTVEEFERTYNVAILQTYGATEFCGAVAVMTPDLYKAYAKRKRGSVGRSWGGAEFRVVDEATGEILPPGHEGLLEVIAPRVGPEWIRTSDLATVDADGFLYIHGRADGAIMRGGFKLLPDRIAAALATHPSVADAAVVGIPDRRLGQVPVAAVELRPGAARPTEDELKAHARRTLFRTHVPVKFLVVDALPRTESMKIRIPAVLAMFDTSPDPAFHNA